MFSLVFLDDFKMVVFRNCIISKNSSMFFLFFTKSIYSF